MRANTLLVRSGCLMLLAACASAPEPTERMASAESAMRAAKEVGANQVPQAQLHTQLAQEQLDRAHKAIADGDNERADRLLLRATADAELALAIAREVASEHEANQAELALKSATALGGALSSQ
jgi:Domain of unknown function (DUF4398)